MVLVATCIVIDSTERKVMKRLRQLSSLNIPIAVTGCAGPVCSDKVRKAAPDAVLFAPGDLAGPTKYLNGVACRVEETAKAAASRASTKRPRLTCVTKLPFTGKEDVVCPIPIASGCKGACTYCITKKARGGLKSRPVREIIAEAKHSLNRGAVELHLCAQDTGVYGTDIGSSLTELLESVCAIDGDFMVRVGMMNPGSVMCSFPELLDAFCDPKIYKFMHLPVQSGDDAILSSMGRQYAATAALGMMGSFRRRFPESTISTDVIVGYPGEGSGAYGATRRFLELARPDMVNVTRFSPRPGTAAAGMAGIPHGRVIKARSRELSSLWLAIAAENNRQWLGKRMCVMADEPGKGSTTMARTSGYKLVVIPKRVVLGRRYVVTVDRTNSINLYGKIA